MSVALGGCRDCEFSGGGKLVIFAAEMGVSEVGAGLGRLGREYLLVMRVWCEEDG